MMADLDVRESEIRSVTDGKTLSVDLSEMRGLQKASEPRYAPELVQAQSTVDSVFGVLQFLDDGKPLGTGGGKVVKVDASQFKADTGSDSPNPHGGRDLVIRDPVAESRPENSKPVNSTEAQELLDRAREALQKVLQRTVVVTEPTAMQRMLWGVAGVTGGLDPYHTGEDFLNALKDLERVSGK